MEVKDYYIDRAVALFDKISTLDAKIFKDFADCFFERCSQNWRLSEEDKILLLGVFWGGSIFNITDTLSPNKQYVVATGDSPISATDKFECEKKIKSDLGEFIFSKEAEEKVKKFIQEKFKRSDTVDEIFITDNYSVYEKSNFMHRILSLEYDETLWDNLFGNLLDEFCFYLSKSLTVCEYQVLDRYTSKRLEKILSTTEDDDLNPKVKVILKRFRSIVSIVRSFSRTMEQLIKDTVEEGDPHNSFRVEGFKRHIPYTYSEWLTDDMTEIWKRSISAICVINYIDFAFLSTKENIESLSAAYDRLERLNLFAMTSSLSVRIRKEIISPNRGKILLLLKACTDLHTFIDSDKSLERKYIFHNASFGKMIDSLRLEGVPGKSNGKECPSFDDMNGHELINKYNSIGRKYLNKIQSLRELYPRMKEELSKPSWETVKMISKKAGEDIWTPASLYLALKYLFDYSKNSVKNEEQLKTVYETSKKLLRDLRRKIYKFSEGDSVPGKISKPFEESYFRVTPAITNTSSPSVTFDSVSFKPDWCDNTVNQFDGEPVVFLCSQSSTPVVVNFFRRFIERCEEDLKDLEAEYRFEDFIKTAEEIDTKITSTKDEIYTIIAKERGSSLQLLGILGAFIALTSASVNVIVSQPETFVGVLHSVTSCILILVIMIYLVSQFGLKNKNWIPASILSGLIIVYLLAAPSIDRRASDSRPAEVEETVNDSDTQARMLIDAKVQIECASGGDSSQNSSLGEEQEHQSKGN